MRQTSSKQKQQAKKHTIETKKVFCEEIRKSKKKKNKENACHDIVLNWKVYLWDSFI